MATDPVCGMDVNEADADITTEYDAQTYYFCSENCKATFESAPQEYI